MKYPKVLQILAIAAAVTVAAPSVVIPAHASETVMTPQEYEAQSGYVLPAGYHYILNGEYVVLDENNAPVIEADPAPAAPEAPVETAAPEAPAEPEPSVIPEEPDNPANTEGLDNTDGSENTENPDNPDNPDNSENTENPNDPDNPGNTENPDNPGSPDDPDNSGSSDNDDKTQGGDSGDNQESQETGEQDVPAQPETPAAPGAPAPGVVQESVERALAQKEQESEPFYLTSAQFKAVHDRIQYNVDVPIEGLPSFITQEMVVGALKAQDETGYPASVTIAQIIQESGYGKYGPGGEDGKGLSYLAFEYCNLFGIKGTGTAGSVSMKTNEMDADGGIYSTYAGFRVYHTYTECIEDRSKLLDEVYSDLTENVTDANTFAMKVGKRWATDIDYGRHLINTMRRYDLYRLDDMTLNEFSDMIGEFANPCPGSTITSLFGNRTAPIAGASTYHRGLDLGTGAYNIPTYAAKEGTVVFAGEAGACGNMVTIDHGDGLVTKYMHHAEIYVEEGDTVEKGQQIGLSGTTGNSTGNHLHFQVEEDGKAVDPLKYLQNDTEKQETIKMRQWIRVAAARDNELRMQKYGIRIAGWSPVKYEYKVR